MERSVRKQIAALEHMTPKELRARYAELFGEITRSGNKPYLVKRIAWRIQANAEGSLSERARQRAAELANDADLRLSPPKENERIVDLSMDDRDPRLPCPGTILTRRYKGHEVRTTVLPRGFEYQGDVYRSLSAVAKAITGSHVNGFAFFNLPPVSQGAAS